MSEKILEAQNSLYKGLAFTPEDEYEALIVCRDYLGKLDGKNLLDVGCGDGYFLSAYFPGSNKFGIEISELADAPREGVTILRGDVEQRFPYSDNFFDAVSSQMLIEHLIDTDQFIAECYRVLKPGGMLVLSTTNLGGPRVIWRLMCGRQPDVISYSLYDGCRHTRYYTFSALRNQLERHGFRVMRRHGAIGFRNLLRFVPKKLRISFFGLFPGLGGEIVVAAQK